MAERNVREPEQPVNYAMLSLFQYMASILVILVHCQRLFENEVLHFTQKSMFGRMAVPFFLISSAFMLKSSLAKKQEMKLYIKRILKQYLLWSGIYVPYALAYFGPCQFRNITLLWPCWLGFCISAYVINFGTFPPFSWDFYLFTMFIENGVLERRGYFYSCFM